MNIRALIADDEPLARQTIRTLLATDHDIEILGEARNGVEAAQAIRQLRPDLVFMDIRMPGKSGFEVLDAAGGVTPVVVFVTAYDHYAADAFRAEALDYLLKPFDDARFFQVLNRVKTHFDLKEWSAVGKRLANVLEPSNGQPNNPLERIVIRSGNRIAIVHARDIDWIESADNYVVLHTGPKTHLIRQTMQELIAGLDQSKFLRVHRSSAVNLDRVRELRIESHGEAVAQLDTGALVKVSRYRRQALEEALSRR